MLWTRNRLLTKTQLSLLAFGLQSSRHVDSPVATGHDVTRAER